MAFNEKFDPIVSDDVMLKAVTDLFKNNLRENLQKESEKIIDETVESLSENIRIMAKNYVNRDSNYFERYDVFVRIEDKRNDAEWIHKQSKGLKS